MLHRREIAINGQKVGNAQRLKKETVAQGNEQEIFGVQLKQGKHRFGGNAHAAIDIFGESGAQHEPTHFKTDAWQGKAGP